MCYTCGSCNMVFKKKSELCCETVIWQEFYIKLICYHRKNIPIHIKMNYLCVYIYMCVYIKIKINIKKPCFKSSILVSLKKKHSNCLLLIPALFLSSKNVFAGPLKKRDSQSECSVHWQYADTQFLAGI